MVTEIHGRLNYDKTPHGLWALDIKIGNEMFAKAPISTALGYFAAIPQNGFNTLESAGLIQRVQAIEGFYPPVGILDKSGYANVEVIGTSIGTLQQKLYQQVAIVRSQHLVGAYLGLPFIMDFDATEFRDKDGICRVKTINVSGYDGGPEHNLAGFHGIRLRDTEKITDRIR